MIHCDPLLRVRLISVAQESEPPDVLIRRAVVWNAFTGEVLPGDIAICADRIAKVGPWSGPSPEPAQVVDAAGRIAVPGYIEPHTHPWPFANPLNIGEAAACRGTTCLVYDDLLLHLSLGEARLLELAEAISAASLPRVFWVARISSQSRFQGEEKFFSEATVAELLKRPEFLCTGEMTRWTDLLDSNSSLRLLKILELARGVEKFNDGHTAGASPRRLPALAVAGLRSCHEAIDAEEAMDRLRQGFWVLLRNSSLRPDLPTLLGSVRRSAFQDRFAYTTDGAKAHFIEEFGFTDYLIRLALEAGVPTGVAYRMATLNPASFLRLEEDLGAVAPGRIADVNLLESLDDPTPSEVICRGRVVARNGALVVPAPSEGFHWERFYKNSEPAVPTWGPGVFLLPPDAPNPFPAGRLANAVITREAPVRLVPREGGLWPSEEDLLSLALTDRRGGWIARGVVGNVAANLEALASSYTTNGGVVVLGRSPEAMADALHRLRCMRGGMVVASREGRVWEFPLPMAGIHRVGGFAEAARAAREFQNALVTCGYEHLDPNYTLLFLSCDFLPDVRATEDGWIRVKTGEVILPSERLAQE